MQRYSEPLVSVIIPVYNSSQYIERCLDSILQQTYDNIEIIVIDDGSTDDSAEKIKKYLNIHDNLLFFQTENYGVSHARNIGIKNSHGDWLTFLDSDDYILNNFVSEMIRQCESFEKSDLIVCQYETYANHNLSEQNVNTASILIADKSEFGFTVLAGKYDCGNNRPFAFHVPWGKLFSNKIIKDNNILFDERLSSGEDGVFFLNYCYFIKNLIVYPKVLYHYSEVPNSLGSYGANNSARRYVEGNIEFLCNGFRIANLLDLDVRDTPLVKRVYSMFYWPSLTIVRNGEYSFKDISSIFYTLRSSKEYMALLKAFKGKGVMGCVAKCIMEWNLILPYSLVLMMISRISHLFLS